MKIFVLIKQVPDMRAVRFDAERGTIDRNSAGVEINPFDLNALEAALSIKDKLGAEVRVFSMGPERADSALREAVARGADAGVLLCDKKFGGSDVLATATVLAAAVKKSGSFDLIFAGAQTVDGDTGQVGAEVAELLNIPHINNAEKIAEFDDESIAAHSDTFGGVYLKKVKYPALITVTNGANVPRLPSLKSKMNAKKVEIIKWALSDLNGFINESQTGAAGSPTRVVKIVVPPEQRRGGKIFRTRDTDNSGETRADKKEDAINAVLHVLEEKRVLRDI